MRRLSAPAPTLLPALALALAPFTSPLAVDAAEVKTPRPNIVIIMSDDMGFSDIGCYGGEIATPNLDALAAGGVRFTQFYNTGRCCPTRASLLTGLYPHQAGVGHMMGDYGLPAYRGDLNRNCLTIAEALKPAGYRNYMIGKWHVTPYRGADPDPDRSNWPLQRGFDRFFGTIHGAGSLFDPSSLTRGNAYITPENDPGYQPEGTWYYTDAISDNAARYIREHARQHPGKPFFSYVAYTAAHWPMHALPEDIAKYEGVFDGGYTPARDARIERLKALQLLPEHWEVTPQVGDWEKVKLKEWEAACMEVYAAMVDNMDRGIGRIVQALKDTGQYDNTLILFLQDNGGCAEGFGRGKLVGPLQRPARPTLPPMGKDELQTEMVPPQSRDGYPLRRGDGVMPGPPETEVGYGRNWANVSNTPFREYKHWVHEGGIATPLIAHWPKGVARAGPGFRKTAEGPLCDAPAHLIDLMATAVDLAGADYPAEKGGVEITPLEGVSLRPALGGQPLERNVPIYFEHEGNRAVRDGVWKLVAKGVNGRWELYDMARDRTETNDLASAHPDIAGRMAAQYQRWAEERGVVPFGSWRKSGAKSGRKGARKARFKLKPGDTLTGETAPSVADRPFTVEAAVSGLPAEGVIAAQGGSSLGWALYLAGGKAHFATRDHGRLTTASAPLPAGPGLRLRARVSKNRIVLTADGEELAILAGRPFITDHPIDGLEVGRDAGGLVGDYGAENAFSGAVESVEVLLR